MPADITVYDAVLRETWTSKEVEEQLYQDNPFLDRLEKLPARQVVGDRALTAVHTGRNAGYSATGETNTVLNPAGAQATKQASWSWANHHQQVKLEGSLIDRTATDDQAVVEALDMEVKGAVNDMRKQITRQAFSNGDARIATCGVTTASTTVVLDPATGYNAIERGWLAEGSLIDIGSAANETSVAADRVILSVVESPTAPTITISGAVVTTAGTDFVSWANNRAGATSFEMNGLRNIVSATSVLGEIDPAVVGAWKANVDTTAQALSPNVLLEQSRKVKQKTGNQPNYVLTSLRQQMALYSQLSIQVQFNGDAGIGAGNVEKVRWAGMEINGHPDAPNEDLYFLTIDKLFLLAIARPYWQNDKTGGSILTWSQGTDAYVAKLTYRANIGTSQRNAHSRLGGLTFA